MVTPQKIDSMTKLTNKIKRSDPEIQKFITALEMENLKLQKQISKLQAEKITLNNRIKICEDEKLEQKINVTIKPYDNHGTPQ